MKTFKNLLEKRLICLYFFCAFISISSAQTWENLASIPEKLTFPIAAAIDGKIHIMGGGGTGGATDKHYQYDPITNSWSSKANIPYKAQQPAGAAHDNHIHFFGGGFPNSGSPLKDHYVYDVKTDTWSKATDLTQARAIHYGVSLNGEVYSMAGQGVTNWLEMYNEVTNSWIRMNNLPDTKFWYGAHVVTHGSIYRFCGGGYTSPVSDAHRYNAVADTWIALPKVPVAIHGLGGAAVGNKIYLVGGYHDFEDSKEVWIYDILSNSYTKGVPLPVGRSYHNVLSMNNCIYSLGGNNPIDPSVGLSFLRFCPDQTTNTEKTNGLEKPIVRIQSNEILIYFDRESPKEWTFQLIDLGGKSMLSQKINTSLNNPMLINTTQIPASYFRIQLQSNQYHFNFPCLLFD